MVDILMSYPSRKMEMHNIYMTFLHFMTWHYFCTQNSVIPLATQKHDNISPEKKTKATKMSRVMCVYHCRRPQWKPRIRIMVFVKITQMCLLTLRAHFVNSKIAHGSLSDIPLLPIIPCHFTQSPESYLQSVLEILKYRVFCRISRGPSSCSVPRKTGQ